MNIRNEIEKLVKDPAIKLSATENANLNKIVATYVNPKGEFNKINYLAKFQEKMNLLMSTIADTATQFRFYKLMFAHATYFTGTLAKQAQAAQPLDAQSHRESIRTTTSAASTSIAINQETAKSLTNEKEDKIVLSNLGNKRHDLIRKAEKLKEKYEGADDILDFINLCFMFKRDVEPAQLILGILQECKAADKSALTTGPVKFTTSYKLEELNKLKLHPLAELADIEMKMANEKDAANNTYNNEAKILNTEETTKLYKNISKYIAFTPKSLVQLNPGKTISFIMTYKFPSSSATNTFKMH